MEPEASEGVDLKTNDLEMCSEHFQISTIILTNWKLRRRFLQIQNGSSVFHKSFSKFLCSFLCVVFLVTAFLPPQISATNPSALHSSHDINKRAAILNGRTLFQDNEIDQSEASPRIVFPEGRSEVRFPEGQSSTGQLQKGQLQRGQRNLDLEEARKASPDVQDIIDGIVKLLGGKVHNNQNKNNFNRNGQSQPFVSSNPQNQNLQAQNFQNQNFQNQQPTPPQIPLNRPYNLFNPTKPIFYATTTSPTPKPTRINNRGPPVPIPTAPDQRPAFEAIPLELLHSSANHTVSLGPPFALTQVKGHDTPEPPYQLGVPLPQQLVPQQHQQPVPQQHQQLVPQQHHQLVPQQHQQLVPQQHHQLVPQQNQQGVSQQHQQPVLQQHQQSVPQQQTANAQRPNQHQIPKIPEVVPQKPLLVPVSSKPPGGQGHLAPPTSLQGQLHTDSIEDDERDAEKMLHGSIPDKNKIWEPFGSSNEDENLPAQNAGAEAEPTTHLEPTVSDSDSEVPSFLPSKTEATLTRTSDLPSTISVTSTTSPQITPTKTFDLPPISGSTANFSSESSKVKVTDFTSTQPPQKPPAPIFNNNKKNIGIGTSTSLGSISTPPLRPGIVLHEELPKRDQGQGQGHVGFGSVEVVAADAVDKRPEIFDVTVTAHQKYGNQATVRPSPVADSHEIITAPNGNEQFVSIDGKRTYFNLHGSGSSAGPTVGQATSSAPPPKSHPGVVGPPSHPFAPPSSQGHSSSSGAKNRSPATSSSGAKSVATSLKIAGSDESQAPTSQKSGAPPSIIRRPQNNRRPSAPPVRIDTCIVGDDSTCNVEQFESCRTESGVSSCMCRPGYARKRHRESCKAIVALVVSIRLDKLGEKKLNYNPDYFNPNSEIYQSLEWETVHGLDSIFGDSATSNGGYIGAKLDAIGFDGRHAVVNSTVLLQEVPNVATNQVKRDVQRQLFESITRHHNGLGKSQLTVEGPISAINAIADMNECENPEMNDCDPKAKCVNTYGSFECRCNAGYGDKFEKDKRRSGRKCESCNAKVHCNGRGECLIENGQNVCKCAGNYYGSQCDIDGEVLVVAIGASVSAVVIIGLTLACLCMWSRRWKREEQKAAIMSRTLFGGVASQAMSYLGKSQMTPYQQHMTLDERLRWAQVDPSLAAGNLYVQTEPLSYGSAGGALETPNLVTSSTSARRSAETCDTTLDDLYEDNRHLHLNLPNPKRPKSRSSQLHYCDMEGEPTSDIYATRGPPFLPAFPAQFCVPTSPMNPYPHSRGFYN